MRGLVPEAGLAAERVLPVCLMVVLLFSGCAQQPPPVTGAAGAGDPYYSDLGNGGYDVAHYDIALDVDPLNNTVTGQTTIKALATEHLSSFNLDFGKLPVDKVQVNGADAGHSSDGNELLIKPRRPLPVGKDFDVMVRYHGQPSLSPNVSVDPVLDLVGWAHDQDGSINVINEPSGARGWFPANDHPRDKATYRFEVTVPKPWIVAAPGELQKQEDVDERTRYVYEMDSPMASYLASINVGKYEIEQLDGSDGIAVTNYFPPGYNQSFREHFRALPEMIEYLSTLYGPYPFRRYGVVVANRAHPYCQGDGAAAEIQTLSIHCPTAAMAAEKVIVHELAHQWFGDSVSLKEWKDIWLKEGMATYAEWLWETRGKDAATLDRAVFLHTLYYNPEVPVGDPSPQQLYRAEVYPGGALVFHALRREVGDESFFEILRTYLERYRNGNAGTEDFIAIAQEVSGRDLKPQFEEWLTRVGTPRTSP